jgi:hypothetical protein
MACATCNCQTTPCGCSDVGLTTPPPCSVNTVFCPTPNPCAEEFSAACIIETGPNLLELTSVPPSIIVPTGIPQSQVNQILYDMIINSVNTGGLVYLHTNGLITSTSIPLIWNSITGDSSYGVYMKLATLPVGSFVLIATVTNTYVTVSSLTANTAYDFYVKGVTTATESLYIRLTTTV